MDLSWKPKVNAGGVGVELESHMRISSQQRYSHYNKSTNENFPSESIGTRPYTTAYFEKGYPLEQDNQGCSSKHERVSDGYISVASDHRQDSPSVKKRMSLHKTKRSGIWAAALPSDTESSTSENEDENIDSQNIDTEENSSRMYLNETENDGDDEHSDNGQDENNEADGSNIFLGDVGRHFLDSSTTDCKESPYFAVTHTESPCLAESHNTKESFTCVICDEKFEDRKARKKHMLQFHLEKQKCLICSKEYSRLSSLKEHMKVVHTNEKPYLCDVCGQTFGWVGALNKHMSCHSQLKLFPCEKCGKSFANSWNLKSHAVVHDEEKPYQCDECGRKFLRLNTLRYHKRTHTNERPYQCDVCERTFTQPNSLKTHKKVHSLQSSPNPSSEEKTKKYGCDLCGRMFALKNTLNVHMMRHRGERPHKCRICEKSFTQSSTLNIHMRTHTGDKPYACDVCGMQFRYNYALQKHVSKHAELGEVAFGKGESLPFDNGGDHAEENTYDDETLVANRAAVEEIKMKILQTLSRAKAGENIVEESGEGESHGAVGEDEICGDNEIQESANIDDDVNERADNGVNEVKDEKTERHEAPEKKQRVTPNDFLAVFQSFKSSSQ